MLSIYWPAILVGILFNMVLGFIWYGPLFGKAWAKAAGVDMSNKPPTAQMVKSMLIMLVGAFLMIYCLSYNVEAWRTVMLGMHAAGQMPGMDAKNIPIALAINSGAWTTVGYIVPLLLNQVAFENKPWKLFFINTGYYFVALTAVSFILAFWIKVA
jgi:hypothetical protein